MPHDSRFACQPDNESHSSWNSIRLEIDPFSFKFSKNLSKHSNFCTEGCFSGSVFATSSNAKPTAAMETSDFRHCGFPFKREVSLRNTKSLFVSASKTTWR